MKVEDVEGIGPVFGEKLRAIGIESVEELLEKGATRSGRAAIVETTGIESATILDWVNHADLMRIRGVGSEYSDLLDAAGVDSPAELARRNAANLAATVQEVVAARPGIARRIPTEREIAGWIAEARDLPKIVEH